MNEYDRFIMEDVIPFTEDLIEQIYTTGKIVLKSAGNALTWNGLSGGIDAIEALRLKRHEQNIRKLLANINNAEEIKDFIKTANEQQTEFMEQVLIKTANLENDIQIFIMARLVQNMTKNGSLNYYESSLFANINTLTAHDYEVFYDSFLNISLYQNKENMFQTTTLPENGHYITSLNKFKSIGIIADIGAFDGGSIIEENNLKISFLKTPFSDIFFGYLQEFFESN